MNASEYECAYIETIARGVALSDGRILLCKAKGGSTTYLPGGHIELGETGREALVREMKEETGLDVSVGSMLIRSGIAEENVEKAMAEIDRQLSDMVAGNISENELALAKTSILSSMKGLKDSGSALGEWYLRRVALGLPSDIDYMMERGAAVTVEEIAELASRAKLKMKYFLRGTQDVKQDTDEEI